MSSWNPRTGSFVSLRSLTTRTITRPFSPHAAGRRWSENPPRTKRSPCCRPGRRLSSAANARAGATRKLFSPGASWSTDRVCDVGGYESCDARIPRTRPEGHPLPIGWGEGQGEGSSEFLQTGLDRVLVSRSSLFSKVSFHKNYSQGFWIWRGDQSEHVGAMLLDLCKVLFSIVS